MATMLVEELALHLSLYTFRDDVQFQRISSREDDTPNPLLRNQLTHLCTAIVELAFLHLTHPEGCCLLPV